jgi:acyl-CoA synthetase (AMP-forming)/AMP-acid ligase II
METLWDRWQRHADARPDAEAIVHLTFEEETPVRRWRRAELLDAALTMATALRARGVGPGEVCALIVRHHPDFYPLYLGVVALGALPAVLAYPNDRLHPDKFRQGLTGMLAHSGLDWVLTEEALLPVLAPVAADASAGPHLKGILTPLSASFAPGAPTPSARGSAFPADPMAPCLVQHSSGTTGLQKAVALSHHAVLGHVERYGRAIDLRADDRIVSWLPLYHDMGLIAAFHLPLAAGVPIVLLSPFEWVVAPGLLLAALASERGSLAWLPNFAYNLMAARVRPDDLDGLDLSTVRLLVNCSEPIQARSHASFAERFGGAGLTADKLGGCYAMAETTFAVTQTPVGRGADVRHLDRAALAAGRVELTSDAAQGRPCVSSGRPIEGCEIRIVDAARADLPAGRVGEILVRSASLFDGYRHDPERTALCFVDGWYVTGDLGFVADEELYVVGRLKDLIIVAGRNLAPEDVEAAASEVPGVVPGRVVAFGVADAASGTEQVWVVAETEISDPEPQTRLRAEIVRAVMGIDVTLGRCVLVPPRWLVKSSSGKLGRSQNRARAIEREGAKE